MPALRHLLWIPLLLPVASLAQEAPGPRQILAGEKAAVVFSPQGGYAPQNFLKRFTRQDGQQAWATMEGAAAELIRRAPPGTSVLIGTFRLAPSSEITEALFQVARTRNVSVKLWLKGPPGLTYMVQGHQEIADRANRYLRERAQQGQQDAWGDFQVCIGTAAQMQAFGKQSDMHQKFGVIGLSPEHGPGANTAFLGTSNMSSSSDDSHNEHRVFFPENPQAAQRLWQEFARLWRHLGECHTFVAGDAGQGSNFTPEPETPRIRLADGGFADEDVERDPLQFRFTYEKRDGGSFHRIRGDFVRAIKEARELPAGETVWVAQFGFQIGEITAALLEAARQRPDLQFRVMVNMKEAEGWDLERVVQAGLPNLLAQVKWDSNRLFLEPGQRPRLPEPGEPSTALLHHKTLLVGSRVLITGSYNFFGDADSQGENVVIVRPARDPAYAGLLADTAAEFAAMWERGVGIDARELFGADGLFERVAEQSDRPGFEEVRSAVRSVPRSAEEIQASLANASPALTLAQVQEHLDLLTRFHFVERTPDGRYQRAADPDVAAHATKPEVRRQAEHQPYEGALSGTLSGEPGALRLETASGAVALAAVPEDLAELLQELGGRPVTLSGRVDVGAATLQPRELTAPSPTALTGTVTVGPGDEVTLVSDDGRRRVQGRAAQAVAAVKAGRRARLEGYVFPDAVVALSLQATARVATRLTYNWSPLADLPKGRRVAVLRFSRTGYSALVDLHGLRGYVPTRDLELGEAPTAGLVESLPGQH